MTSELERDLLADFHRHRRRCEYAEAEEALRAAAAAGAGEAAVELAWGRLEFARHDHAAALERFLKAIELGPLSDEAIGWRVAALSRLYHFEEAQRVGEEGLRDFPGSTHIGVALGRAYLAWEKPVDALACLEHVLDEDPADEKALEWRVYGLLVLIRYAEAEAAAQNALKLHPASPGILDSAARIYIAQGRYDSALDCYDKVLRVRPDDESALCGRISVLREACRFSEGRVVAAAAVEMLPESAAIQLEWSYLEEEDNHLVCALELADQANAIGSHRRQVLNQRIDLLRKLHRYAEAVEMAVQAIGEFPRSPGLMTRLAWCRFSQGLYQDMLENCDLALKVNDRQATALQGRAVALRKLRRYAEAEEFIAHSVAALPHATRLLNEWGMLLHDQGRHEEALERFERTLGADPFNLFAAEWRTTELRCLHRFAAAEEAAEAAVALHPPTAQLFAEQGSIYVDQDQFAKALTQFDRAIEVDEAYANAYAQRVHALLRSHRFREAEEAAQAAIERFPEDAYLLWHLGAVYVAQGLDERGLREYRRAAALDPGDPWLQSQVGSVLFLLNRYAESESLLQDGLKTWPDDADIKCMLGHVLLYQNRYDAAFGWFLGAQGDSVNELTSLCIFALKEAGRFEEAEMIGRTAVKRRPDISRLHIELAEVYSGQGRYAEAESTLRTARRRLPEADDVVYALIQLYRWLGRFEDALVECDEMLAGSPQLIEPNRLRIDLLKTVGRYPEAIRAVEDAMIRHPTYQPFVVQFGWLKYELGAYDEALTAFERGVEMDSGRWACYGRAKTLCKLGRHAEAILLLREEIALRPTYPQTWTELSEAYEDDGRHDGALDAVEQASRVDPFNLEAVEARLDLLRRLRRWEQAEGVARAALARFPRSEDLAIAMGRILDDRNEYADALAEYDRALEIKPMYNTALVAKSSTLRSLRRFAEAEQLISTAVERFPMHGFLRVELGWIYRDQGRRAEARRVFERLRDEAVSPAKRAEACIGLGWVAFTGDDHQTAARHFRQACEADARSRDAKVGLAWALAAQDDKEKWAEAEGLCLDVLGTRPDDLLAHTCLGVLYYRRREYAASEHHLKRTIELDPYDGGYVDLGALYVQLGRFAEAEELLDKALERDWYDAQAHIEYGNLCLQWDGDEAEVAAHGRDAVRHFRQALSISPGSAPAAIGLAIGLTRAPGDFPAAERVLRDALDRIGDGPSRAGVLLALARLLIERGDLTQRPELYREAVTTAKEAIDRAGTEAEAHFVAGVAMYKVGASDEVRARPFLRRRAVRYLRECVRRDPSHVEGRRLLLLAGENLKTARGGAVGSFVMTSVAMSLLITMWVSLFFSSRITTVMLTTLTPVLVGLVALGFVLPLLVRLKLPGGVEADLSASLQQVSSGPTGDMSIGPGRIGGQGGDTMSMAPFPSGPRGQLPRLE